jgi:hypothetical protein
MGFELLPTFHGDLPLAGADAWLWEKANTAADSTENSVHSTVLCPRLFSVSLSSSRQECPPSSEISESPSSCPSPDRSRTSPASRSMFFVPLHVIPAGGGSTVWENDAPPLRQYGRTVAPVVAWPHLQSQAHRLIDDDEVHRGYRDGFILVVFFGDKSTGGSSPASSSPSRTASPRRQPTPRPSTRAPPPPPPHRVGAALPV